MAEKDGIVLKKGNQKKRFKIVARILIRMTGKTGFFGAIVGLKKAESEAQIGQI